MWTNNSDGGALVLVYQINQAYGLRLFTFSSSRYVWPVVQLYLVYHRRRAALTICLCPTQYTTTWMQEQVQQELVYQVSRVVRSVVVVARRIMTVGDSARYRRQAARTTLNTQQFARDQHATAVWA